LVKHISTLNKISLMAAAVLNMQEYIQLFFCIIAELRQPSGTPKLIKFGDP